MKTKQMTIEEITPKGPRIVPARVGSNGQTPFGFSVASHEERDFQVIVEPDVAEWTLGRMHPEQRTPSDIGVDTFRRVIRAGRFVDFMEPGIYFDVDGYVVNARHRLTAQVAEHATLGWRLKIGTPAKKIAALDQGRSRTLTQTSNLTGVRLTAREEAVIKLCMRMSRAPGGDLDRVRWFKPTVEELLAYRESQIIAIAFACGQIAVNVGSASFVGAVAYAYPVNPEAVQEFVAAFVAARAARVALGPRSPIGTLARYFNMQTRGAGAAYTNEVALKSLSALRAHIRRQDLAKVYATPDPLLWFQEQRAASGVAP